MAFAMAASSRSRIACGGAQEIVDRLAFAAGRPELALQAAQFELRHLDLEHRGARVERAGADHDVAGDLGEGVVVGELAAFVAVRLEPGGDGADVRHAEIFEVEGGELLAAGLAEREHQRDQHALLLVVRIQAAGRMADRTVVVVVVAAEAAARPCPPRCVGPPRPPDPPGPPRPASGYAPGSGSS